MKYPYIKQSFDKSRDAEEMAKILNDKYTKQEKMLEAKVVVRYDVKIDVKK